MPPSLPHRSGKDGGIFGIDLGHYQLKNGEKRLKRGQNQRVLITFQLTGCFCKSFILCNLH
jgi:hypothetical protein